MLSLKQMVDNQVSKVIKRGQRLAAFDQLRSRHFWSSYLFIADPTTFVVQAGPYDIFKVISGGTGQGYPTNTPLTVRETNWLNSGRVPDNQNFVITEIGVTLKRPPAVDSYGTTLSPGFAPANGIWANLPVAVQAAINDGAQLSPVNGQDAITILYGGVLEMSFLTNNVPLGLLADFSQSAGGYNIDTPVVPVDPGLAYQATAGDPVNGIPAAAFRRKLEVPILLQHGENMGMRINFPRNLTLQPGVDDAITEGTIFWFEIRVDWWAHESFAEES